MRRISMLVTLLAVTLGIACADLTGPEAVAGTYTLQTVNGEHSPWFTVVVAPRVEIDGGEQVFVEETIEFISSTLQLNADASFSVADVFRSTEVRIDWTGNTLDTTVTTDTSTRAGTFTVTGTSIQLTTSDGTVNTASLSGDVLTMTVDEVVWVWER